MVDLAAYGECGNRYAATADRSACIGDNVAILEVWPYDPDAVVPRPQVTTTRVRIEAVEPDTMASESFRGNATLDDELLENAVWETATSFIVNEKKARRELKRRRNQARAEVELKMESLQEIELEE